MVAGGGSGSGGGGGGGGGGDIVAAPTIVVSTARKRGGDARVCTEDAGRTAPPPRDASGSNGEDVLEWTFHPLVPPLSSERALCRTAEGEVARVTSRPWMGPLRDAIVMWSCVGTTVPQLPSSTRSLRTRSFLASRFGATLSHAAPGVSLSLSPDLSLSLITSRVDVDLLCANQRASAPSPPSTHRWQLVSTENHAEPRHAHPPTLRGPCRRMVLTSANRLHEGPRRHGLHVLDDSPRAPKRLREARHLAPCTATAT